MNCRYIKILLVLACVTAFFSCSKEWNPDGGARVAVMTLSPSDNGAATRSNIDTTAVPGNKKVTWSVADEIYWWTSSDVSGTPGDKRKYAVLADAESVEIPVSYNDNDQYVTFYTAGGSVGGGTTSDMTKITFSVPQRQDGTFASNHVAVHKSKLILEASAASMKPVATMLRFTLSTLTYAGKTVDNIRIGCMDGTSRLWGDFKVTMDNSSLGAVSSVDKTADAVADATPVIIDKRASTFQTGVPYYVAIRPNTASWPQGIYFDLYSGDTKLARVIVRDSAGGGLTLTHGKIRDLGDLKAHVNIQTSAAQMTIYPPYAAFTKDMPSTGKKFWLRVEPEDFSGEIEWTVTKTSGSAATDFTITPGDKEDLTIDGKSVSCWTATVGHTGTPAYSDVILGKVWATAKVKGEADVTKSAEIEMGEFIEMGTEDADGNRILWCYGEMGGSLDPGHLDYGTEDKRCSTLKLVILGGELRAWGYLGVTGKMLNYSEYHRWDYNWTTRTTDGSGGKYRDAFGLLGDEDNVCKVYAEVNGAYGYDTETHQNQWDYPMAVDFSILTLNSSIGSATKQTSGGTNVTARSFTSKIPGFTDCSVYFKQDRYYWGKDYITEPGRAQAALCNMNTNPPTNIQFERCGNRLSGGRRDARVTAIRRVPKPEL